MFGLGLVTDARLRRVPEPHLGEMERVSARSARLVSEFHHSIEEESSDSLWRKPRL